MSEAERQATEDMFVAEAIERSLSDGAAASPAAAAVAVGPPAQPHAQPAASWGPGGAVVMWGCEQRSAVACA